MLNKIINCYDSHTHFWATGQVAEGLQLQHLKAAGEVSHLVIKNEHRRANWITGFGWNQNNWAEKTFPEKKTLDLAFPDTPVFFSRTDGHASWINTAAINELKKLGYDFSKDPQGGKIYRDATGETTGLLFDQAHINALVLLPDFSTDQHRHFYLSAQNIFNRAGFTHIRDLSMTRRSWALLRELEKKSDLSLCVDSFITVENLNQLTDVLFDIEAMRSEGSEQLRIHGVKIYIDGSLGSQTAYLSENYNGSTQRGLSIWSAADIKELLQRSWQAREQVAIHCIGDAAVHAAVLAAREVSAQGVLGRLHLEHVQLLRNETLQMMKPLHVTCYLQPCHWLSDHMWLKEVLPESLQATLFQWELLRKNKIAFYFGSDSPIERPSLFDNRKALFLSAENGVPMLNGDWKLPHSHPDVNWCPSYTEFDENEIRQVYFKGRPLL